MARFQPTIDIWLLAPCERAKLQPGQHVTAGPDGPRGRFLGEGRASTVVAWRGNASRALGGPRAYHKALRDYAKSVRP